ncbi:hypothetical protein BDR26DRAFT_863410 [Obelidium mucronatum]|nr:hypothetical protein BDR26DRAFT_863410 [Obelidium mucronatum]
MTAANHRFPLIAALACFTVAFVLLIIAEPGFFSGAAFRAVRPSAAPKQRLVFVDLGANRGDSYEALLGVGKKFNYTYAIPEGRSYGEFEAHLFEANPVFNKPLVEVRAKYEAEGKGPIHIYPSTVVYTIDKVIPFFFDLNPIHDFWGSSVLVSHGDVKPETKREMLAVDIARFILINFKPDDHVVVKMDIEGAEYDILPHLVSMGASINIDYMYIEMHQGVLPSDKKAEIEAKGWEAVEALKKEGVIIPPYNSAA